MFLSKVFANLIFQAFVAYGSAKTIIEDEKLSDVVAANMLKYTITYIVAILMFAFTNNIISRFALFTVISMLTGVFLSQTGFRNVKGALLDAIYIFICMFTLGVATHLLGYDLRVLGPILIMSLIGLIIARLVTGASYARVAIALFAIFIVYDTDAILKRNYEGNFVRASFDYFVDIFNIFSGLLEDE
jgi:FtsH-binding integral membrane protein